MNNKKLLLASAIASVMPSPIIYADGMLEEVVVTARKRSESLQETPLSVVALGAENLEQQNISDLKGIEMKMPNVAAGGAGGLGGSNAAFFVRGIGTDRNAVNQETPIALYVDDAYYGRTDGALLSVLDVAQVEVSRGPQGTLFGRGATGGAIRYITQKPTDELEAKVQLNIGSENRRDVKAVVNLPVSEDVAFRFTGATLNQDGHVKGVLSGVDYGDKNSDLFRAYMRWQLSDNAELLWSADYTKGNSNGGASVLIARNNNAPFVQGEAGAGFDIANIPLGDYSKSYQTGENFYKSDNRGSNLTINWGLSDSIEFKSSTSWRKIDVTGAYDTDGTPASLFEQNFDRNIDMLSQEFQFSGEGDGHSWLAGFFYYSEEASDQRDVYTTRNSRDRTSTRIVNPYEVESYAVFGQASFDLNDQWSLTSGLRYTYDDKSIVANELNPAGAKKITEDVRNSDTWSALTGRISLEYQMNDDVFLFTSLARGYRSGGFNDRIRADLGADNFFGITAFDEETLDVAELGLRSELLDQRLRFNMTFFYGEYDDMQISSLLPGTTRNVIQNIGAAEISGLEGEFTFLINDVFSVDGAFGYLNADYTRIESDRASVGLDSDFARAPEISYAIGLEADWGETIARIDYGWKDDFRSVTPDANFIQQEAYGLLNANVRCRPEGSNWQLSIYGTNLTDEHYLVSGIAVLNPVGIAQVEPGRFREFGVKIDWEL
ncbi:TonB-dependent receptor [Pseudoteredinibacter isoporae]|uniref:Iron complex outermembrane receptor protein n=1 Tax=Pseudoteredinibacter isoporae TaxID=570281 RepID=A0A7X0JUV8_9GAMM|nr:TonB-dependent receptor [Pseudoteredinibacter isoporae]MBB6522143.1 iron complex outermembrane receptor protein [Pseudoteredinibacter isoporae]NHO87678.1 TonB-dependent receptor [Pseudoteredinibacter isoporae]NIB23991.1 TonB-dependent receptor [Pseudoteredinibacter isoporae]